MPPLAPPHKLIFRSRILVLGFSLVCLASGVACGNDAIATAAPSPTAMPTPTMAPTPSPTAMPTPTMAPTLSPTAMPTPTMAPTPSPTTIPTPIPEAYVVTITSSDGEEVVLTQPPMRIVSYGSAAIEILFAIGEGDRVVGAHDFVAYPPEAAGLPKVGTSFTINLEEIVALEPDLIYTFYGSSAADLKRAGAPVIYLETPTTLEGIVGQMRMWGRITDNEAAADQLIRRFEAKLEKLQGLLASVEEGPTLFHDDSLFYSRGPNTLVGKVYEMLKVQNIAFDIPDGGYGQLSSEVVVERNPEVIITTFPDRTQEILSDPALRDISAVKEGRVHTANADLISIAGPRFVEAIEELARFIHPGLFE